MKPMLRLINPVQRAEPFDHADWVFEAKFDGFRAAADTVHGRLISRNGNRMKRFEEVLDLLPKGHVFGWRACCARRCWSPTLQ
jgi:ATP-dependent DNA ligase